MCFLGSYARKSKQGNHVRNSHASIEDIGNGPNGRYRHVRANEKTKNVKPAINLQSASVAIEEILETAFAVIVPAQDSGKTKQSQANHQDERNYLRR